MTAFMVDASFSSASLPLVGTRRFGVRDFGLNLLPLTTSEPQNGPCRESRGTGLEVFTGESKPCVQILALQLASAGVPDD